MSAVGQIDVMVVHFCQCAARRHVLAAADMRQRYCVIAATRSIISFLEGAGDGVALAPADYALDSKEGLVRPQETG